MEKPSRQQIIENLKKAEWMTMTELSKQVGISPMAVRQHLMSLERQGLVQYVIKKTRIGRPVSLYRLTERAESIFPKGYSNFLNELIDTIERVEGKGKLERILLDMFEKAHQERQSTLAELSSLREKVQTLAEMLNQEGYMIELDDIEGGFELSQYNCPLSQVSSQHPEICRHELDMYRKLLNSGVERTQWHLNGNTSCKYVIPQVPS